MFVNLTPHPVTIRKSDGTDLTIRPSGSIARVDTVEEPLPDIEGVPAIRRTWGKIQPGISIEPGKIYIVSSLVLNAIRENTNWEKCMVAPDTGETAIRDEKGQIQAVTRVVRA